MLEHVVTIPDPYNPGETATVNVEDFWMDFMKEPHQTQLLSMLNPSWWCVMLHRFPAKDFLHHFLEPQATAQRARCMEGVMESHNPDVARLREMAENYDPFEESAWRDREGVPLTAEQVGHLVLSRLHAKDYRFFARLSEEPPEEPMGESLVTQRWVAFCDFVIKQERLPCKAELRELWDVTPHTACKYFKLLGLGGLPRKS